ncbi:MAG TPA: emopamil-binding family protein [Micromonosporaceae bacterium]|nr:emopamil-binding family protein [Micromonosporaceae bacterium]
MIVLLSDRVPRPLRRRRVDIVFIAFFVLNLGFITYFFDIEQLTVANATHMTAYPAWPPAPIVDLVHWYGNHWDPLLMARPAFFRMTIWIDVVAFGPFYAAAIYAFVRGRDWIRVPALVWSGVMMANVAMILFEERAGVYATPHFAMVLGANLPWGLLPVAVIARLARDHPFTAERPADATPEPIATAEATA